MDIITFDSLIEPEFTKKINEIIDSSINKTMLWTELKNYFRELYETNNSK